MFTLNRDQNGCSETCFMWIKIDWPLITACHKSFHAFGEETEMRSFVCDVKGK